MKKAVQNNFYTVLLTKMLGGYSALILCSFCFHTPVA